LDKGRYRINIEFDDNNLCFCDIGSGPLTWDSYSILLVAKEQREIVICVDPKNMTTHRDLHGSLLSGKQQQK